MHAWCCKAPETPWPPKYPAPPKRPQKNRPRKKKLMHRLQRLPRAHKATATPPPQRPSPRPPKQRTHPPPPHPQEAHTHTHTHARTLTHSTHTKPPNPRFLHCGLLELPTVLPTLWPNLRLPRKPTPMAFNAPHQCLIPMFLVSKGLHSDFSGSTAEADTPDMPLGMAESIVCKKQSF